MKPKHLKVILSILLLGILLTACSGASATNSWAGLTASDTAVYFTNSSSIVAVKTDNGNAIWTYPVQATSKGLFSSSPAARYFSAAPAVVGEQLIVGDYTGLLVSLSTRDGKEMWQFTGAKGRYIDAPLIVNDTIIAQNADGTIHALDLNGNVLWTFKSEHAFWATPVSDGKTVFATSMDHFLYALNLSDGTLKWKTDLSDPLVGRPLLTADGTLYVGTLNNTLYSVKAEDGSVNWKQTLKSAVWATPVMIQDRLYIGDQAGNIYLIKAADGSLIQTIEIGSAILGNGVVVGDKLAFGDEKGEVILIGINGERAWTRSLTGKIYSNLVFSGDHLYVLTTKGDQPLHAFDANGNEIWNYSTSK